MSFNKEVRDLYLNMRKNHGRILSIFQSFRYVCAKKVGLISLLNNEEAYEYNKMINMDKINLRREIIKGGMEFIFSYPMLLSTIPIVFYAPMEYKFVSIPLGALSTLLNLKGECKISAFYHRTKELNLSLDELFKNAP